MRQHLKTTLHYSLHLVAYYIVWFACILNAAYRHPLRGAAIAAATIAVQLIWQYQVMRQTAHMWRLCGILLAAAAIVDTSLTALGVITFQRAIIPAPFIPLWIVCIWLNFGIESYAIMPQLVNRPFAAALFALFGFPFAYAVGARLGAITLPYGYWSAAIWGVIWAGLLPFCYTYYLRNIKLRT